MVVYCTGYKISFPFFDADLISAPDNHIELFRRVFHPEFDDVFFVALLQPLGATMPLAEAQGQWIADYLKGEYALPPRPGRCGTSRTTTRRWASATWPPSATPSRSTSTTTCGRWARSAGPAPSARAGGLRAAGAARAARGRPSLSARRRPRPARAHQAGQSRGDPRRRTRVFADIGYGAATVRDIVRGTDLATGTFYNYFPDKESVLRRAGGRVTVEARAGRSRAARRPPRSRSSWRGFRAYFEFLAEDPDGRARCAATRDASHAVRRARRWARASTSSAPTSSGG